MAKDFFAEEVSTQNKNFFEEEVKTPKTTDFFAEETKEPIQESITEPKQQQDFYKEIEGEKQPLWKSFGQALAMQTQSIAPAGEDVPQLGLGFLEEISLGAIDVLPPKSDAGKILRATGKYGLAFPLEMKGLTKLLSPFKWLGRIIGTGAAGGAREAVKEYFKGEELNPKEIGKEALIWGTLEGAGELVISALQTKQAIDFISKTTGKSKAEVAKFLANRFKTKWKEKFGFEPTEKNIVKFVNEKPNEVAKVWENVNEAAKETIPVEAETIKEVVKPKVSPTVPTIEKPKIPPVTDIEKLSKPQQEEYSQLIADVSKIKKGREIKNLNNEEKSQLIKKYETILELPYLNDYDKNRYAKDLIELGKPKRITEKKHSIIYRGYGRDKKESVYGGTSEPILGEGKYYAFSEKDAKKYGPNIEKSQLNLKQPLNINSDSEWRKITKEAGWKFPNLSGMPPAEIKKNINSLNKLIKSKGYDGVVISWSNSTKTDVDKFGNEIKLLRNVFDVPQVYVPKETQLPVIREAKIKPIEKTSQLQSKKQSSKKPVKSLTKEQKLAAPRKPVIGKQQAAKRSDIIKLFRKAFTDPIRLRKFKQRATGIHKMWPKVTRLLNDNDIETAAHEIGHNLHTTLYGGDAQTAKEQRANVSKALRPYLNELKPIARYEPYGLEGFAEFTRMYVTNPKSAKELAPKFYNKFEKDLTASYPELKDALLKARDYYESYLQGTPESRIDSQISYPKKRSVFTRVKEWIKNPYKFDKFKLMVLDDVFPAKRAVAEIFGITTKEVESLEDERNLYIALRNLKAGVSKADSVVEFNTFDFNTLEPTGEGYLSIIKQLKDPKIEREFNRYLIARRAIEKYGQKIATGINYSDAVLVEAKYRDQFKDLTKQWDGFWNRMMKYLEQSGLYSKKQVKTIKDHNLMYAPFNRDIEKKGISGAGSIKQTKRPLKRMKGSTADIIPPVEAGLVNIYNIVLNAEKNYAGQVLAKLADMKDAGQFIEQVPTPTKLKAKITKQEALDQILDHLNKSYGLFGNEDVVSDLEKEADKLSEILPDAFLRFGATTYPAGENIITVFFEGKPKYYEVSKEIYNMWLGSSSIYTLNMIPKSFRFFARTLRAGATLNPRFMAKNIVRDTWDSWIYTKFGKSVKDPVAFFTDMLYQPLAMVAEAANKGPLFREWMRAGGGMSTMQSVARDQVVQNYEKLKKGFKPYQIIRMAKEAARWSEEANRLAEYARASSKHPNTRWGKELSAYNARDISIDFLKIGLLTKAINAIIPFYNNTFQGTDKFLRTLANPKTRGSAMLRLISFIAIPSMILWWLNKDDEEIQELPENTKDSNFLFRIQGKIRQIPVPWEPGVIFNGLTRRMMDYIMKRDPDAFRGFFGSVKDATTPSIIPALPLPFIEQWANKSFYTGRRIIPPYLAKVLPKYQYKSNTSMTARYLGRAMDYMLGGDTKSPAASPLVIQHFINTWLAGVGRIMLNVSDMSLNAAGLGNKVPEPYRSITEKLGLDAFNVRNPRSASNSIERFYDMYEDEMRRRRTYNYLEKTELETEEEIEKGRIKSERIYDTATLQNAYKAMQMCQKEINMIYLDPHIDSKTKAEMIDDLYLEEIKFAKEAVKEIQEYRKDFKK